MILFPAIDLKNGKCVRLVEGRKDQETIYSDFPEQIAQSLAEQGAEFLHIVDLDGAFTGAPQNREAIQKIAQAINLPFQVGGGIRSLEIAGEYLALGAARVIIGTKAVQTPEFIVELITAFGPERVVLGIDVREGQVAIEGWVEKTEYTPISFGQEMYRLGVRMAVYTDVSKDGKLQGPNLEATTLMAQQTGLKIIASGGVSKVEDIQALKHLEAEGVIGAIIGKALYDGKLAFPQALAAAAEG